MIRALRAASKLCAQKAFACKLPRWGLPSWFPLASIPPEPTLPTPIIKVALGRFAPHAGLSSVACPAAGEPKRPRHEAHPHCSFAYAQPPLNVFLGMVLVLVSVLLFLALATYHASDPSLNTATDLASRRQNWIGLFGAYLSDLLLQSLGLTAFLLPVWLGGVGWTWMHSRPGGSPLLRWLGTLLSLAFRARRLRAPALALALAARGAD